MLSKIARYYPGTAIVASAIIMVGILAQVFADSPATQPTPADAWAAYQSLGAYLAPTTRPAPATSQPTTRPDRGWECINGAANNYYGINRWADVGHGATGFWQAGGNPFQYTPHGFPVGANINAISQLWMNGCPAGDYNVEWAGRATVNIAVTGGTYTVTDANHGIIHLPAEGTVAKNQWGMNPTELVTITVTNSDPANPLDNLHVWQPEYGPGTPRAGQWYDDRYLALLKNFAGYRAMNDGAICYNTPWVWAKRVVPDQWDWTSFGEPPEAIMELAKEAGLRRLWVCVPYPMSPADAAQMAAAYRAGLPAGVQLVVEPANELWNWGFAFRHTLDTLAAATPAAFNGFGLPQSTDPNIIDARAAAEWGRSVCQPFADAFADRPGDCVCIFCGQASWNLWVDAGLEWLNAKYGTPAPFTAIGIAPYYGYGLNDPTLDALIGHLTQWCTDAAVGLPSEITAHTTLADKYHMADGVWDYEGDQHLPTTTLADGSLDVNSVTYLFQLDPRAGNLQDLYFAELHRGHIRVHFSFAFLAGNWDKFGFWPVLRSYRDSTPRWDALQRECIRSN